MAEDKKRTAKQFPIRLPKFNFNWRETGINGFLVFSLVIFAFLLGMLTNKVLYLEEALKQPTAAAPVDQAAAPAPPSFVEGMTAGKLPALGNKDAKVTIVEFSDFQCPFCKKYFDETHKQIMDTYVKTGKAQFAYRHFPLSSIHPNAQIAGEAAECANEQGKFEAFHDLLFTEQETWSPVATTEVLNNFVSYAGQLGMNTEQFRSCVESGKFKQNVDDDTAAATAAQVDATPTFFVNGNRVVGAVPFADLQKAIEEELKK